MTEMRKVCKDHICGDSVILKGVFISCFLMTEMSTQLCKLTY